MGKREFSNFYTINLQEVSSYMVDHNSADSGELTLLLLKWTMGTTDLNQSS